jgi:hypothetical protein
MGEAPSRWRQDDVALAVPNDQRTGVGAVHDDLRRVPIPVLHEVAFGEAQLAVRRAEPCHRRGKASRAARPRGRWLVDRLLVDEVVVDVVGDVVDYAGRDCAIAALYLGAHRCSSATL